MPQEEEDFAEDPELPEESPAVKDPHFDQEVGVGVGRRRRKGVAWGKNWGSCQVFHRVFVSPKLFFLFFFWVKEDGIWPRNTVPTRNEGDLNHPQVGPRRLDRRK